MPSKKWQNSRQIQHRAKCKKDSPVLPKRERAKRRNQDLAILQSRALRTSPTTKNRPRSQSLPVALSSHSSSLPTIFDRKRIRRGTLLPGSVSPALAEELKLSSTVISTTSAMSTLDVKESKSESSSNLRHAESNLLHKEEKKKHLVTKTFDVLLNHAGPPKRFIGIDIDDTVLMTAHSPSLLLTTFGVEIFQRYVHKKIPDFKTKNHHCRELEKSLKEKILVQSNIATVIRDLQDSGCWVFGVTARYQEMAGSTERVLASLGINLARTAPFPPQLLRDPKNGTVIANGIIYCNGISKGLVLNRFFEHVVFRNALKNRVASNLSSKSNLRLPDGFVFIDDQLPQINCILKDFTIAKVLNLPLICYHYSPDASYDICATMDEDSRAQILTKQMDHFICHKTVLTNQEALDALKSCTGLSHPVTQ